MTTIVCTREGMAADSRMTSDMKEKVVKIHRVGEKLIGFAGSVTHALKFIHWYDTREGDTPSLDDTEVLVLSKEGIEYWDDAMYPIKVKGKFTAIGSGSQAALGAMFAGADMKSAVRIACKIDTYSDLPVKALDLEEE